MALKAPRWMRQKREEMERILRDEPKAALLSLTLQMSVPFEVMSLAARGGPNDTDWYYCREFSSQLGAYGDRLLFRTPRNKYGPGTADMFAGLARSIAVMAFLPGGVNFLGTTYRVDEEDLAIWEERRKPKPAPRIKRRKRRA